MFQYGGVGFNKRRSGHRVRVFAFNFSIQSVSFDVRSDTLALLAPPATRKSNPSLQHQLNQIFRDVLPTCSFVTPTKFTCAIAFLSTMSKRHTCHSYSTHKLQSWSFTSLSQSGSLRVVGANENGQLGLGDNTLRLRRRR
jgi:hypothetical protein